MIIQWINGWQLGLDTHYETLFALIHMSHALPHQSSCFTCLQCALNRDGTKFDHCHCHRKDRPGGGLGLVYRDNSKVQLMKHNILRTFEYAICKRISRNICFHIIGISSPPYSAKHPVIINNFIDEISKFLADILPSTKHWIITGDFNIRIYN